MKRHTGNDTKCDKCGKLISYGDEVIYSWDYFKVYHPECTNRKEQGK